MKASDFVFCVDLGDESQAYFCITSSEYFEENGCINDGGDDENVSNFLPRGFSNSAEGTWEYNGDWRIGKEKLLAVGFVYNEDLHEFINNYQL